MKTILENAGKRLKTIQGKDRRRLKTLLADRKNEKKREKMYYT